MMHMRIVHAQRRLSEFYVKALYDANAIEVGSHNNVLPIVRAHFAKHDDDVVRIVLASGSDIRTILMGRSAPIAAIGNLGHIKVHNNTIAVTMPANLLGSLTFEFSTCFQRETVGVLISYRNPMMACTPTILASYEVSLA